jgi:hypothetical protein
VADFHGSASKMGLTPAGFVQRTLKIRPPAKCDGILFEISPFKKHRSPSSGLSIRALDKEVS